MDFYKLFELKCVCTQPPYNENVVFLTPSGFFFLIKSFHLSQIKPISDACLCDATQTQGLPQLFDLQ